MSVPRSYHPYIFPTTPTTIVYYGDMNSASLMWCVLFMSEYAGGWGRHIDESVDCLNVGLVSH